MILFQDKGKDILKKRKPGNDRLGNRPTGEVV